MKPVAISEARKAMRKLHRAFEYLRPRMVADTMLGIAPNDEALVGSILAEAECAVLKHYVVSAA